MKYRILSLSLALALPLTACDRASTETPTTDTSASPIAESPVTEPSLTDDWQAYTEKNGRYQIKFPEKPIENNQQQQTPQGQTVEITTAIYEDEPNKRVYVSSVNEMPLPEGATFDVEKGLDGGRDGATRSTNSTVVSEEKIDYDGLPGRSIVMSTPEGAKIKMNMLINAKEEKALFYQVWVAAQDGNIDFPEAQAFLDSLEIARTEEQ
ncbi:hypothetical protein [Lusitaniella coriacea]|uniref:hypothetical protein n=1 Tax=Lusitaniella coriacea TaxID=1983105 RepID=UPI003CF9C354